MQNTAAPLCLAVKTTDTEKAVMLVIGSWLKLFWFVYLFVCLFAFTGITIDIFLKSADLLLRPPFSDWLQRVGLMVLLFSVLYR